MTSLKIVKGVYAELLEVKSPWSVRFAGFVRQNGLILVSASAERRFILKLMWEEILIDGVRLIQVSLYSLFILTRRSNAIISKSNEHFPHHVKFTRFTADRFLRHNRQQIKCKFKSRQSELITLKS